MSNRELSNWELVAQHVTLRPTADVPESIRRVLSRGLYRITYYVILEDPELPPALRWIRVLESADDKGLQFLQAFTETTPEMVRYYLPTAPGAGFCAKKPVYEGHWRASFDEVSELPWPIPDPSWMKRSEFLQKLDAVESVADGIEYRGISLCRLCGQENGHRAFRLDRWEWPSGFRHYVAEHGVRPSEAFESFIGGVKLR